VARDSSHRRRSPHNETSLSTTSASVSASAVEGERSRVGLASELRLGSTRLIMEVAAGRENVGKFLMHALELADGFKKGRRSLDTLCVG
jgi:hypothetical protein